VGYQHPSSAISRTAKGSNSLVLQRRSIKTKREILRKILQSTKIGKFFKILSDKEYGLIKKDP